MLVGQAFQVELIDLITQEVGGAAIIQDLLDVGHESWIDGLPQAVLLGVHSGSDLQPLLSHLLGERIQFGPPFELGESNHATVPLVVDTGVGVNDETVHRHDGTREDLISLAAHIRVDDGAADARVAVPPCHGVLVRKDDEVVLARKPQRRHPFGRGARLDLRQHVVDRQIGRLDSRRVPRDQPVGGVPAEMPVCGRRTNVAGVFQLRPWVLTLGRGAGTAVRVERVADARSR